MKDSNAIKEVLAKFNVGDGLTNVELDLVLDFYTNLVDSLTLLGPEFYLARTVAQRSLFALEGFKAARDR